MFTLIEPAGAPKAREGVDRGFDGSSLPEKTRDATEAADRRDAAAGDHSGTETETGPMATENGGGQSPTSISISVAPVPPNCREG